MANLYSSNTFACYASLVSVKQGWVPFTFGQAQNLLEEFKDIPDVQGSSLAIYVKFLKMIGEEVNSETNILSFSFDENLCHEFTSAPVIRKLEGKYVIQIGQDAIDLLNLKKKGIGINIKPDIFVVGEGQDKQDVPVFQITLPTVSDTSDEYGQVEESFGLKVDPIKVGDDWQTEALLESFKRSAGAPETMALVADFKTMNYNPSPKEMAIGDYHVMRLEEETRKRKDGSSSWKTYVFTFEDGSKCEASSKMAFIKALDNPLSRWKYNKLLESGAGFWLRIAEKEEKYKNDGSLEKVFIKGGLFEQQPPALKAPTQIKQVSAGSLIPELPPVNTTSQTIDVQAEAVQPNSSKTRPLF